MTARKRKAELIQPHVATEHTFYTAALKRWMGGYEPVLADMILGNYSTVERSKQVSQRRDAAMAAGEDWAKGTIPGIGKAVDEGRRMRLLKNSQLG